MTWMFFVIALFGITTPVPGMAAGTAGPEEEHEIFQRNATEWKYASYTLKEYLQAVLDEFAADRKQKYRALISNWAADPGQDLW